MGIDAPALLGDPPVELSHSLLKDSWLRAVEGLFCLLFVAFLMPSMQFLPFLCHLNGKRGNMNQYEAIHVIKTLYIRLSGICLQMFAQPEALWNCTSHGYFSLFMLASHQVKSSQPKEAPGNKWQEGLITVANPKLKPEEAPQAPPFVPDTQTSKLQKLPCHRNVAQD